MLRTVALCALVFGVVCADELLGTKQASRLLVQKRAQKEKTLVACLQFAAAKGKLTCKGKPAKGVLIKLFDEDT